MASVKIPGRGGHLGPHGARLIFSANFRSTTLDSYAHETETKISFSTHSVAGRNPTSLCFPGLRHEKSNRFDEAGSN
jgi:hypothetical protein